MTAQREKQGSSLAILWIVLPVIVGLFAAFEYGPKILSRYEKGQVVRFGPKWVSIKNTSRTNWTGGEAVINGQHKVRFGEIPSAMAIAIHYVKFTNGLSLEDIQQFEVKVDNAAPIIHKPRP